MFLTFNSKIMRRRNINTIASLSSKNKYVQYKLRPVLLQQFISAVDVTDVITHKFNRNNLKISVKKMKF